MSRSERRSGVDIQRRSLLAAASGVGMIGPNALGSNGLLLASSRAIRKTFWPDGVRLVISISMQFESGGQGEGAEPPFPFPPLDPKFADTITPTWYAYGVNEGIPRLLDLWDRHRVKVTCHMIGTAVERHPALAREIVERGHEAAAHGQTTAPPVAMTPNEERLSYWSNIASIEKATGVRPVGFNASGMRQAAATLGILQELGFSYHVDDLSRDEPLIVSVNGRPFGVVPYTLRNNDLVRFGSPGMTARQFAQDLRDEFDVLYAESAYRRRMMSIATHDRISGNPLLSKALGEFLDYARRRAGVAFWRKDRVAEFAIQQPDTPRDQLSPRRPWSGALELPVAKGAQVGQAAVPKAPTTQRSWESPFKGEAEEHRK